MGDVSEDAAVRAMVGGFAGAGPAVLRTRGTDERPASPSPASGEARISLEGVHVVDRAGITRLRDASLDVRGGEILGVIGIEGSGQRELVRVMAGRQHATSGTVRLPQRVGFVPEDRLHDALLPEWSLLENTLLAGAGRARGLLQRKDAALRALRIVEEFHVRAPNIRVPVSTLSGGNQQRFVLGREMLLGAQALVVENPTHGLDVRATRHVLDAIARAAHETNVAVVFSSSDTEEVLATADRVVVCFAGRVRELRDRTPAEAARALVGLV